MTKVDTELKKEVQRLQAAWYDYVARDHHKDRDCHFYVELDYAYDGTEVSHTVSHRGYLVDRIVISGEGDNYLPTLKKAILAAIKDQLPWVNNVLKDPEQWDEFQQAQAGSFKDIFGEWINKEGII